MGNIDQTLANQLINAMTTVAALPALTGPVHCRIMTVNGSASALGTELATSGGYTSGTGAPTVGFASAAGSATNSNTLVSVTNMPAATEVGIETWDSSGTPRRIWWGPLAAPKTTNAGDTFSILSGQISFSFP